MKGFSVFASRSAWIQHHANTKQMFQNKRFSFANLLMSSISVKAPHLWTCGPAWLVVQRSDFPLSSCPLYLESRRQARLPPRAASSFCLPLFISQVRPLVAAALKRQVEITSPAKTSGLSECLSKKKKWGDWEGRKATLDWREWWGHFWI